MKERSPHLAILSGAMNVVSVTVLLAQVGRGGAQLSLVQYRWVFSCYRSRCCFGGCMVLCGSATGRKGFHQSAGILQKACGDYGATLGQTVDLCSSCSIWPVLVLFYTSPRLPARIIVYPSRYSRQYGTVVPLPLLSCQDG